jgi:6-phosphogluconolactonase
LDPQAEIRVFPDRPALVREAASRFVLIANESLAAHGRFGVALAGGTTPRGLYELLATREFSSQIDWRRAHLFWGDERAVPPYHPDSNFRMANEALIKRIQIPHENVHRISAELPPDDAAKNYELVLGNFFLRNTPFPLLRRGERRVHPRFDLILLGLGEDAHTASLFPRTAALHETKRWVMSNYVEKLKSNRITLTPPVLNASANLLFLVTGADKANAVHAVLRGGRHPEDFPAQLVQPSKGNVLWLLDQEAGARL